MLTVVFASLWDTVATVAFFVAGVVTAKLGAASWGLVLVVVVPRALHSAVLGSARGDVVAAVGLWPSVVLEIHEEAVVGGVL